jgi:outer membrane protein
MPSDMRKLFGVTAVVGLLFAGDAHAQFANRSLGGGLGFIKLFGGGGGTGVDFAVPLSLEGTLYIENGFDVFAQIPLMVVSTTTIQAGEKGHLVFGTGGHLGVRYLFLEETIRPYAGLELAGFVLITNPSPVVFIGPGAVAGIDFFVGDTVSIGVRTFFDLFIELNVSPRPAFGGVFSVATYF